MTTRCVLFVWLFLSLFSTPAIHAVTVTAPNGGEMFSIPEGSASATTTISWDGVTGTNDIVIDISANSGVNWRRITTLNATGATSYIWDYAAQTIDGAPFRSMKARIRVIVNGTQSDTSDNDFSVFDEYEPTPSEQRTIFLINRGRQDPTAEGLRYVSASGGDIMEGITDATADAYPQQPMIWNENLTQSARLYSQWMWDHDLPLSHTHTTDLNGDTIDEHDDGERALACGYDTNAVGENIAVTGWDVVDTETFHEMFIDDTGIDGRGHRLNCLSMTPNRRYQLEMGVGRYLGASQNALAYRDYITEDYGYRWTRPSEQPAGSAYVYIVGNIYDDISGNGEYDADDGLGAVTIQAFNGATPVGAPAYSRAAGGYQLKIMDSDWGDLTIKAYGGGFGTKQAVIASVTVPAQYIDTDNDDTAPGANASTSDDAYYAGNVWLNVTIQEAVETQRETITLAAPASGDYLRGIVDIDWTASGEWAPPDNITIELRDASGLVSTLASDYDKDASPFTPFDTTTVPDGTDYRIRLSPVNNPDNYDENTGTFTVDNSAPSSAVPQSPTDNETDVALTVTLTASAGSDTVSGIPATNGYRFDIAQDASFTVGAFDSGWIDSPIWQPGNLASFTTYFWRVTVRDRAGNETQSASAAFTTLRINSIPEIAVTGTGVSGAFPSWTLTAQYGAPLDTATVTGTDADGVLDTLTMTVSDAGTGTYTGNALTITGSPATGVSPVSIILSGAPDAYGTINYDVMLSDGIDTVSGVVTVFVPTTISGTVYFDGTITDATQITATLYQDGSPVSGVSSVNLSGTATQGSYTLTNVPVGTGYTVVFSAASTLFTPNATDPFDVTAPTIAPALTTSTTYIKPKQSNTSGCMSSVSRQRTSPLSRILLIVFSLFIISRRHNIFRRAQP